MIIGFDASRAFVGERTGTENYSYQLLRVLAKIDRKNTYRVYLRPKTSHFSHQEFISWPQNFEFKLINWPRLWTQGGLALECLLNPPDVLFIPAHTLPVIRRPKLKTVVTIHDLGVEYLPAYHQFPQKYYLNWATIYAVKNATRIIAVSENTKKDLITKLYCDTEVVRVILEAVDASEFKIQSAKFKVEETLRKYNIKKPYILFVGTIQPRKNIIRLIEAFAHLTHARGPAASPPPSDVLGHKFPAGARRGSPTRVTPRFLSLILIGKPGWLYEEIYAAPKKYGVEERVRFLNFVSDDESAILYQEANVFCLPSLYEGFGLPVLEAMAAGLPVVASNISSLPEVVGDAGVLVDPYNSEDIARGLEKVLINKALQEELVKKGKERVKKFTWEKTAKETLQVLEEAYRISK